MFIGYHESPRFYENLIEKKWVAIVK
jgi:hypothetical protein